MYFLLYWEVNQVLSCVGEKIEDNYGYKIYRKKR